MVADLIAGRYGHVNYDVDPVGDLHRAGDCLGGPDRGAGHGRRHQREDRPVSRSLPADARGPWKSTAGFAKIVADADSDRILGVHIIGPMAGELIAEAVLALEYAPAARTCSARSMPIRRCRKPCTRLRWPPTSGPSTCQTARAASAGFSASGAPCTTFGIRASRRCSRASSLDIPHRQPHFEPGDAVVRVGLAGHALDAQVLLGDQVRDVAQQAAPVEGLDVQTRAAAARPGRLPIPPAADAGASACTMRDKARRSRRDGWSRRAPASGSRGSVADAPVRSSVPA